MLKFKKNTCTICLDDISANKFHIIMGVLKEAMNVVLPSLNLHDTSQHICSQCSSKLYNAFDFKAKCLDTEDTIYPYISSQENSQVHNMLVETTQEELGNMLSSKTCRLCMKVGDTFLKLKEKCDTDMIQRYLPELNFNITKDPLICKECSDSLECHVNFLKNCLNIEKVMDIEDEGDCDMEFSIKTEIDINFDEALKGQTKSELNLLNSNTDSSRSTKRKYNTKRCNIKQTDVPNLNCDQCDYVAKTKRGLVIHRHVHNRPKTSEKYRCKECHYETISKKRFRYHILCYKVPSNSLIYECNKCDYQTKFRCNFKSHMIEVHVIMSRKMYENGTKMSKCTKCDFKGKSSKTVQRHYMRTHQEPSRIPKYKCNNCDFETTVKRNLAMHQIVHKDPSLLPTHECHICGFESKNKASLAAHIERHAPRRAEKRDPTEKRYKCDQCDYMALARKFIRSHSIIHKDLSEIEMFKCNECDFQTKHKLSLRRHCLIHKDVSEIQTYQCYHCEYATIHRTAVIQHLKKHRPVQTKSKPKNIYKCEECRYQTPNKKLMRCHELKHKDPSEIEMAKCDSCDFQSKYRTSLFEHKRTQHTPNLQLYECDKCDYRTKYRYSLAKHHGTHKKRSLGGVDAAKKMYSCDLCDFKSKDKLVVKYHQLNHEEKKVIMHECEKCGYETKFKSKLKKHYCRVKK